MSVDEEINFLSDQALSCDEIDKDRFSHERIAETIRTIVVRCPTPFTIGLFGRWGTGKSSIANFLIDKLRQEDIIVVNFDVWKYEKDSLRRTFLQSVVKAFKKEKLLEEEYSLEDELYKDISISVETEPKFSLKRIKILLPYLIASYIITSVILYLLLTDTQGIIPILIQSLIIPLFLLILQDVKNLVVTDQKSTTYKAIDSPEKFDAKFKDILKHSKIKGKYKRVAIIIDNLDRCSHDKATELLSTVKTFLEVPEKYGKCIFIIPCADDAIKEHLKNIYNKNTDSNKEMSDKGVMPQKPPIKEDNDSNSRNLKVFDPDEFLRKFFNTYVRIPEFIDTELQDYTEGLLKDTKVKELYESEEVAHVITVAFRENPRQIKQFINTLLSYYLIAKEREEGDPPLITPKGTITNNLGFLAKIIIIRQKYPTDYEKIKEERLNSTEINELKPDKEDTESTELKKFLISTRLVPRQKIRNIRPFIYFKQSKDELKIPDHDDLEIALLDNTQNIVNEKFKSIPKDNLKYYERFIISLLNGNRSRTDVLFNIVSSSLIALEENSLEFLNKDYYNTVADIIYNKLDQSKFDPSLIFNQIIEKCDKRLRDDIVRRYAAILSAQSDDKKTREVTDEWVVVVVKELINHMDLLKKNKKQTSKALSNGFIPTISEEDIKNKDALNNKIQLLLDFKEVMTTNVIEKLISRFSELLKSENKQKFSGKKENFLIGIKYIFDTYHELITKVDEKVLVDFGDLIIGGINASDPNQKKIFIFTCLWLEDILSAQYKPTVNPLITNFWTTTDSEGIEYVFKKLDNDVRQEVIEEYWTIFMTIVVKQQDIFNVIWDFSTKEKRRGLFEVIIRSSKYQWGLNKLEELKYKIDFNKKEVVSILLDVVAGIPLQHKGDFYKAINTMKCGHDSDLQDNYSKQLKTLLKTTSSDSQKVGYDALFGADYLSEIDRRSIALETIEWLMKLDSVDSTHQHSIKSVNLNHMWGVLTPTDKDKYMSIIFDKILNHSSNIDVINIGLEAIHEIKPKYEEHEYEKYFNGLLVRLEKEDNETIKNEIKNGLLKIRPDKLNNQNKEFWEKFEKI